MVIFKITAEYSADSQETRLSILEFPGVKETAKSYLFAGKRFSKNKLHHIEVDLSTPRVAKGTVYVLADRLEEFKSSIVDTIVDELYKYNR